MEIKKQNKYKKGDKVKFFYYYEDKIGIVLDVDGTKHSIEQISNKIIYPCNIEKIYGKIVDEVDSNSNKTSSTLT